MQLLCATDLLPKSEAAIERAGALADRLSAHLSLLHVVEPSESERALRIELQQAIEHMEARACAPLWRFRTAPDVIVKVGEPPVTILESITKLKPSMVILGPHRRRGLLNALSGTIAERILNARKVPVLIAREPRREEYRNVLLALDLSPVSRAALQAAESLILGPEARATIVHAYEPPYKGMLRYAGVAADALGTYAGGWRRQVEEMIHEFVRRHSRRSLSYDVTVAESRPTAAVLSAADRMRPDLLVMGTHARSRVGRVLLGSVSNAVLSEVRCDVLIVPDGSFSAADAIQTGRVTVLHHRRARAALPQSATSLRDRAH